MTFRSRNLWDDMALFPKAFDHWLEPWPNHSGRTFQSGHYPPVNLEVSPEQYSYYVFAAGLDKQQLHITAEHGSLVITGEKPQLIPKNDQVKLYRNERLSGQFTRAISLPRDTNIEHISAQYHNGVLHIRAQRMGKNAPTNIKVK